MNNQTPATPRTQRLLAAEADKLKVEAFDKAARELGVDAAELARSLDLAALIRAAHAVVMCADNVGCSDDLTVTSHKAVDKLAAILTSNLWPRT